MNHSPNCRDENNDDEPPLLTATKETLESFHNDVKYLWCSDIQVYEEPPTSLQFLRNHVALSKPCIIRNSICTTAQQHKDGKIGQDEHVVPLTMTLDDLVALFPEAKDNSDDGENGASSRSSTTTSSTTSSTATSGLLPHLCVDATPDGHGDCLRRVATKYEEPSTTFSATSSEEKIFVKPLEIQMSLADFRSCLRKGRTEQQQQQQQQQQQRREQEPNCREIHGKDILDRVFEISSKQDPDETTSQDKTHDQQFLQDCVLYYSRQNDCLRQELSPIWNLRKTSTNAVVVVVDDHDDDHDDDVVDDPESFVFPRSFAWAEEAFFGESSSTNGIGVGPDAVNLWIGDERAVSAMHKDHYENLFYVLSGEKVFHLCPPSDAPFLYEQEVLSGRFEVSSGSRDESKSGTRKWSVVLDRVEEDNGAQSSSNNNNNNNNNNDHDNKEYSRVHWIATNLFGNHSDRTNHDKEFPLSKYAHPITVSVKAGELLYLPSLWFHRVSQTTETIGINYWYDMNFESPMWCYFHFLQQFQSRKSERGY